MATADEALGLARSKLHYEEGPRDNETPFGAWAGTNFQAWCQAFASWVLDQVGLGIGKVAYVPTAVGLFKATDRLFATPQRGDLFFLWFPSKSRYAHVGFVDRVDGDWIVTLEGNSNSGGSRTGGMVVSNRRKWRGTRTVFGRPAYSDAGAAAAPPGPPVAPPPAAGVVGGLVGPLLRRGGRGDDVKRLQEALNRQGAGLVVDGDFGPGTEGAAKTFQRAHGLEADGIVGPRTWAALT